MSDLSFLLQSVVILAMSAVFYCLVVRPSRAFERNRWMAVKNMEPGTKVVLSSGMAGIFQRRHGSPEFGEYEVTISNGVNVRVIEQGIRLVLSPDGRSANKWQPLD